MRIHWPRPGWRTWLAIDLVGVIGTLVGGWRDHWLWILTFAFAGAALAVHRSAAYARSVSQFSPDAGGVVNALATIASSAVAVTWIRPAAVPVIGVVLGLAGASAWAASTLVRDRPMGGLASRQWHVLYAGLLAPSMLPALLLSSFFWPGHPGSLTGRAETVVAAMAPLLTMLPLVARGRLRIVQTSEWALIAALGFGAALVAWSSARQRPEITIGAVVLVVTIALQAVAPQSATGTRNEERLSTGAELFRRTLLHTAWVFALVLLLILDWVILRPT